MKSRNFGYVQVLSAYCGCYKTNIIKQGFRANHRLTSIIIFGIQIKTFKNSDKISMIFE